MPKALDWLCSYGCRGNLGHAIGDRLERDNLYVVGQRKQACSERLTLFGAPSTGQSTPASRDHALGEPIQV